VIRSFQKLCVSVTKARVSDIADSEQRELCRSFSAALFGNQVTDDVMTVMARVLSSLSRLEANGNRDRNRNVVIRRRRG